MNGTRVEGPSANILADVDKEIIAVYIGPPRKLSAAPIVGTLASAFALGVIVVSAKEKP